MDTRKEHRVLTGKRAVRKLIAVIIALLLMLLCAGQVFAGGEELYEKLSAAARNGDTELFNYIDEQGDGIDWASSEKIEFEGNLRFITIKGQEDGLYIVRPLDGEIYIVYLPEEDAAKFVGMDDNLGDMLIIRAQQSEVVVDGESHKFIRFTAQPEQLMLDKVFETSIVIMFFFVMLGMGLNLTLKEFIFVFKKPKGILVGIFLQWVLMPVLALGMAYALGFYQSFPFIYAGMVLICACPGGVTSNLMTYYAKGDLALSVSLTSISTVLALLFTPLLLTLFCSNIPDVNMPTGLIAQTISLLVLLPLVIGMLVRWKWKEFAKKVTPFFSALGVVALLIIIGVGLYNNFEKLADTERYSLKYYIMVVSLSILGMMLALGGAKLFRLNNLQSRAISMEVGLRNSTLAVTIALLIQDVIGDYYASMFVTTAIYGITMYITGFLMIYLYKFLLPLKPKTDEALTAAAGEESDKE